jgi:hypothetical protein
VSVEELVEGTLQFMGKPSEPDEGSHSTAAADTASRTFQVRDQNDAYRSTVDLCCTSGLEVTEDERGVGGG